MDLHEAEQRIVSRVGGLATPTSVSGWPRCRPADAESLIAAVLDER